MQIQTDFCNKIRNAYLRSIIKGVKESEVLDAEVKFLLRGVGRMRIFATQF